MQKTFGSFLVFTVAVFVMLCSSDSGAQDGTGPTKLPLSMTSLHQWTVTRMIDWSPPGKSHYKHAAESEDEAKARYESIARDAAIVAYDPSEKPIFHGKYARAMTLGLIVSVALHESGYRKDVDFNLGPHARGDNGQSWCLSQIKLGRPGPTGKTDKRIVLTDSGIGYSYITDKTHTVGWGGEDLVNDRTKCFRTSLRMMRTSFSTCRKLPVDRRLTSYASGGCTSPDGMMKSEARVRTAQRWFASSRPPLSDEQVLTLMEDNRPADGSELTPVQPVLLN